MKLNPKNSTCAAIKIDLFSSLCIFVPWSLCGYNYLNQEYTKARSDTKNYYITCCAIEGYYYNGVLCGTPNLCISVLKKLRSKLVYFFQHRDTENTELHRGD